MAADIALGQRAVNRVAQRMDADIGIGVAGQSPVVRYFDASQDQLAPILERVDVKP